MIPVIILNQDPPGIGISPLGESCVVGVQPGSCARARDIEQGDQGICNKAAMRDGHYGLIFILLGILGECQTSYEA